MSIKNKWVFLSVAILLAFNVWQWWPASGALLVSSDHSGSSRIRSSDIQLSAYAANGVAIHAVKRDLFSVEKVAIKAAVKTKSPVRKKPVVRKSKKTVSQSMRDLAQSGLMQFRLVAVLFQQGEKSAYLVKGDKDYSVKKGDRLEGRYLVKDVTLSTVTLQEINSKNSSIVKMQ